MKLRKTIGMATLTLAILQSTSAYSAVTGSLVYSEPTGTVGANDVIDVRVTLTLDSDSDPLTYNASDAPYNGVNTDDFPLTDVNGTTFTSHDSVGLFTTRTCNDTFAIDCGDPGSEYSFSTPSSDSWFGFDGTLDAGESMDFHLYDLTPTAAGAAPGHYELYTIGLGVMVYGLDSAGSEISAEVHGFRTTCMDPNCTFSRDVAPIPIPGAAWLFGSAMLGLMGMVRKRA
ncbi:MAG: hypothetical protein ABW098_11685 [Candidatus Thiodiazotropha sp.]